MNSFVGCLFVLNFFTVYGMNNISFYTEQEHQALQICSQEYNTVLGKYFQL